MHPDVKNRVVSQQAAQKSQHDQHSRTRELYVGQRVLARNYRPGEDWIPGTVIERRGPHSYAVQVSNGQWWHRHIDQLKEMEDSPQTDNSEKSTDIDCQAYETVPDESTPAVTDTTSEAEGIQQPQSDVTPQEPVNRYPKRICTQPDRLTYKLKTM